MVVVGSIERSPAESPFEGSGQAGVTAPQNKSTCAQDDSLWCGCWGKSGEVPAEAPAAAPAARMEGPAGEHSSEDPGGASEIGCEGSGGAGGAASSGSGVSAIR